MRHRLITTLCYFAGLAVQWVCSSLLVRLGAAETAVASLFTVIATIGGAIAGFALCYGKITGDWLAPGFWLKAFIFTAVIFGAMLGAVARGVASPGTAFTLAFIVHFTATLITMQRAR